MNDAPETPGAGARTASSRVYPVAAVVIALVSVLDPLSRNLHQASWADAAPALLAATAFALGVWLLAALLRRRADAGAALIAFVWSAGALHYLELSRHLNGALGGDYSQLRALPFAIAAMILLTWALRGSRAWHGFAQIVVACMAGALLLSPLWRAAAFEWEHGASRRVYDGDRAFAEMPALAAATPAPESAPERAPDIYHFVFDRYGSEETLAEHFGVRDPIGAHLEEQGFYVARDSFANYVSTGHALAAAFQMEYLDALAADPRAFGNDWRPIFAALDDSRVGRFLRGRGYEHRQYGSWWVGTFHNPNADANRPLGFSEFGMAWLRRSIALPLFHLLPDTPFTMRLNWDNGQCQRVARQIEEIKRIAREREAGDPPLYVFAHILVPHGPFVFAPDGTCLTRPESEARGARDGYAEQVAYADAIIRDVTETLLAPGRPEPVLLIQADEGPIPERDMRVPWQEASDADLRIKFGILSAFRLPGGEHGRLRQDISPVNSYRAIFSTVFGLDLPDLPDRMFVFPDHRDIWSFHDVTERVRCRAPAAEDLPSC